MRTRWRPRRARAAHQRATDAALKFAQTFPEHPESAVVLTRAAQDLYAAGDQAQAMQSAQLLLARTPRVSMPPSSASPGPSSAR